MLFLVSIVFNGNVRNSSTIFSVSLFITIKQCTMIHHLSRTLNIFEEYEIVHFLQGYLNSTLTLSYFFLVYLVNKPLQAVGRSSDNVRDWDAVRKMNIWLRSEASRANVKFWGKYPSKRGFLRDNCPVILYHVTLNSRLSRAKFNEKVIKWNIFVN